MLEAISGVSFPMKDTLCTRFATELVLRKGTLSPTKAQIVPGADRSDQEKGTLHAFSASISADNLKLDQVIAEAMNAMGLNAPDSGKNFSSDVLRIELSGSEQPHLTLVDLPGLFESGNLEQSEDDAKVVKTLVLGYMTNPRSIILAVVSAKSDFSLQKVTKYARKLDPSGIRTLGLITKPDTLDNGSEGEEAYLVLAQNNDVKFRLGWHVLRNRDYKTRNVSNAERDQNEAEFFAHGVWEALDPHHVGITSLKPRLSHILRDHILLKLPDVLSDVETGIDECENKLAKLGASRTTIAEQRQYLLHVSHEFYTLIKAAVRGIYDGSFFGRAETDDGHRKRLRAVVQNTLLGFSEQMRKHGHALEIVDGPTDHDLGQISRSDYAEKVKNLMVRSRGCELPGTYNPLIIGEMFREQCVPWESLIKGILVDIFDATQRTVGSVLSHVADDTTEQNLLQETLIPGLKYLQVTLNNKVAELLEPHTDCHPITYNHSLTENVQKTQAERRHLEMEQVLKNFFCVSSLREDEDKHNFSTQKLLFSLVERTEADVERYACYAAIDMMEAYYKACLFNCPIACLSYRRLKYHNAIEYCAKTF